MLSLILGVIASGHDFGPMLISERKVRVYKVSIEMISSLIRVALTFSPMLS